MKGKIHNLPLIQALKEREAHVKRQVEIDRERNQRADIADIIDRQQTKPAKPRIV
jgi:hypothetical protein